MLKRTGKELQERICSFINISIMPNISIIIALAIVLTGALFGIPAYEKYQAAKTTQEHHGRITAGDPTAAKSRYYDPVQSSTQLSNAAVGGGNNIESIEELLSILRIMELERILEDQTSKVLQRRAYDLYEKINFQE